jgi:hypothetical protein
MNPDMIPYKMKMWLDVSVSSKRKIMQQTANF